jgi:hypothetical protein
MQLPQAVKRKAEGHRENTEILEKKPWREAGIQRPGLTQRLPRGL